MHALYVCECLLSFSGRCKAACLHVSGGDQCHSLHRCWRRMTSYLTLCFCLAVYSAAALVSVDVGGKSHSCIIFLHLLLFSYCQGLICLSSCFELTAYFLLSFLCESSEGLRFIVHYFSTSSKSFSFLCCQF